LAKGEKAQKKVRTQGRELKGKMRNREGRGGESGDDIEIRMEVAEAMPALPHDVAGTEVAGGRGSVAMTGGRKRFSPKKKTEEINPQFSKSAKAFQGYR
jgi:hypothetical protein